LWRVSARACDTAFDRGHYGQDERDTTDGTGGQMSALRDQVKMWAGQFIKTAKLSSWGQKWGTVNIAGAAVDTSLGQKASPQSVVFYQW
ncbi:hypothetical protein DD881_13720, partial [Staphylococcus pseudintermedius]